MTGVFFVLYEVTWNGMCIILEWFGAKRYQFDSRASLMTRPLGFGDCFYCCFVV